MNKEDFMANEEAENMEDGAIYSQAQPFCQQSVVLQRLQFAHSASVASVTSMSPANTPPRSPPQPAVSSTKVLSKQQQQHQQSPPKKSSTTAAPALIPSAVVTAYHQQQQQISHRHQIQRTQYEQQQQQQQSQPEQMISATGVSASAAATYKLQQQKLRELHSLALEGGDTARGYCSCDEQWTSSSPTTSGSPTLSCTEGHEKTSDGRESNETPTTTTTAKIKRNSSERVAGNANKPMNVTTGHDRLAVRSNGAGHSRTWQPPNRSSIFSNNNSIDGSGHIWSGPRANEVAKAAAAVVAAKAAASAAATSTAAVPMPTRALRPVPAVRLKQQHHVRFSDEKNFSD